MYPPFLGSVLDSHLAVCDCLVGTVSDCVHSLCEVFQTGTCMCVHFMQCEGCFRQTCVCSPSVGAVSNQQLYTYLSIGAVPA